MFCSLPLMHIPTSTSALSAGDKQNPPTHCYYDHKCCKSNCIVQLHAAFKQCQCVVFVIGCVIV